MTDALYPSSSDREAVVGVRRRAKWRKYLTPSGIAGIAIVVPILLLALFAPYLLPRDPLQMDYQHVLSAPSALHPLGTDESGRDILARIVYGSRSSLSVGFMATAIALGFGVPLGLIAGYFSKSLADTVIMRGLDALLAFPPLLLAIALLAALGPSLRNAMLAIGVVFIPTFARVTRANTMSLRQQDFVQAAEASGASNLRRIARHIFPNLLAAVIVQATLTVAFGILSEVGLSFLGLGTQPPDPSWGSMLARARSYYDRAAWYAIFPGAAVFLTVLGFQLIGDWLSDVLDPRRVVTLPHR